MQRIILKISGEALSDNGSGISMEKVNAISEEIKELYDSGDIQLGIICGAGNMWRGRDAIRNGMDRTNADYMEAQNPSMRSKKISKLRIS